MIWIVAALVIGAIAGVAVGAAGGRLTLDPLPEPVRDAPLRTSRRRRRPPRARARETSTRPPRGASDRPPRPPAALARIDLAAPTAYGLIAFWLLSRLFADPRGTYLSQGVQDQQAFEWYFGAAAHNLVTLSNPLFSTLQNWPTGVNLLANASVLGLSIPFAPITVTMGPHWTFVLIEWLGFTATATCWYLLLVRRLHLHRVAAAVGGAFVAFSPPMVSHGNGHPNFLTQFLVPVIIDRLAELQRPGRTRAQTVRAGVVLGLVVTWQLWMGEEVLLLAAVGIALFGGALWVQRRLDVRTMLPGTLVGAATTVVLFAFPLWWQFAGPQSYRTMWQPVADNDLAALWGRATRTIGADPWAAAALSLNRTEENAFFGIPLWFLLAGVLVVLWRRPIVRAGAIVVLGASWLSLGADVTLHGSPVPLPGLWPLVSWLPLFDGLLPTRFTLIAVPALAVLVAIALDAVIARAGAPPSPGRRGLTGWVPLLAGALAIGVALAPMVPTRLWADQRPAVPEFFTGGHWRDHVTDGAVLAVPPPDIADLRATDWQAAARWRFPLVEGYFMGPDGSGEGTGSRGAVRRPFSLWLAEVARSGVPALATPTQVTRFREDLRAWDVDVVVLPERADREVLRVAVESVLGPAQAARDVLLWDVRTGTDGR